MVGFVEVMAQAQEADQDKHQVEHLKTAAGGAQGNHRLGNDEHQAGEGPPFAQIRPDQEVNQRTGTLQRTRKFRIKTLLTL